MNRLLSLLLLGALLATACIVYRYEAESPETRTWPATEIGAVEVRVDNGAIAVTGQEDTVVTAFITKSCKGTSEADAEEHLADITTGDSTSGTTLYLWGRVPTPNNRSYNTEYELTAPPACGLRLVTTNGAVELYNMAGPATVVPTNGAVRVANHSGGINVQAANGAIDCDIVALEPLSAAVLHSSNGRVTLYLPADASVTFEIVTSNGTASVVGFTGVSYTQDEPRHKTGTIGAGEADVVLRSDNGNVTIQVR